MLIQKSQHSQSNLNALNGEREKSVKQMQGLQVELRNANIMIERLEGRIEDIQENQRGSNDNNQIGVYQGERGASSGRVANRRSTLKKGGSENNH